MGSKGLRKGNWPARLWVNASRFRRGRSGRTLFWYAAIIGSLANTGLLWPIVVYLSLERGERTKARHFAAWNIINTAGTGDGGRREALEDLIGDGVSLAGVHFNGTYLKAMNFGGADLSSAEFDDAILANAKFSCAKNTFLSKLVEGDCKQTNLTNATFKISFDRPLARVDFGGARLVAVTLAGMGPEQRGRIASTFSGLTIQSSWFKNVFLLPTANEVTLEPSTDASSSERGVFDRTTLSYVDFSNVDIDRVSFDESSLDHIDFSDSTLHLVSFLGVTKVKSLYFFNTHLSKVYFKETPLERAQFRNSHVSNSVFENSSVSDTTFSDSPIEYSRFINCSFIVERYAEDCEPSETASATNIPGQKLCTKRRGLQINDLPERDRETNTVD